MRALDVFTCSCTVGLALAACGPAIETTPTTSPASAAHAGAGGDWITTLGATHPLVGHAWDSRAGALGAFDAAKPSLQRAPIVLLGEKHDNPDHHRLQARALGWVVASGRRPAVLFEMIDRDLQPAIDEYLARPDASVDGLGQVLEWDKRGWPAWSLYRPIFAVVMAAHLPVVATGLGHALIHEVMKSGLPALPPELAAHVRLDPLAPELAASLAAEIKTAHCDMLPEAMLAPMSLAQRVKDAVMAELTLARATAPNGAVLIAGNGHVRSDRGVPEYLRRAGVRPTDVLSVSIVEVADDTSDPQTYAKRDPADLVVFTPRIDDDDPCAKFRK